MKITEFKTQYQDLSPYFGLRKGKLYSGGIAVDGTPVDHYGPVYRGTGKPENGVAISSLYDTPFSILARRVFVEGPVQQRNPRTIAATLRWRNLLHSTCAVMQCGRSTGRPQFSGLRP